MNFSCRIEKFGAVMILFSGDVVLLVKRTMV